MQGIPGPVMATALAAGLSLSGYCSCPDNHVVPINRRPDLTGPTVSAVSVGACDTGIAPTGVSPTQPIAVVFSERMDPATVSPDTVLVVAGDVDETFLSDVNNPPLSESRRALIAPATLALSPDGSTLTYTLTAPLAGLSLYTLVVSEDVRDVDGAPLVDALGQAGAFTCPFYTADAGSGPPLASLLNPPPGATVGVPPNIRAVVVGFSEPVMGVGPSSFRVTDANDAPVDGLVGASDPACAGAVPLTCFGYVFSATLAVSTEFTILLTSDISDNDGNPLAETSFTFTTADTVDTSAPVITNVAVTPGEDSATVRWDTDEPSTSLVHWAQGAGLPAASLTMASTGAPGVAAGPGVFNHEVIVTGLTPLTTYSFAAESRDVADNFSVTTPADFMTTPPLPRVAITEIYANAFSSMEKWAEYIELYNFDVVPWDVTGWQLDNAGSFQDLPPAVLMPGEVVLLTGTDFHMDLTDVCAPSGLGVAGACDVDPPAGTPLLMVPSTTLTTSGLSNSGETYRLVDASGVSISTYFNVVSTSSNEGTSVERIDPTGPDVAANWARNPDSTSTPGVVP